MPKIMNYLYQIHNLKLMSKINKTIYFDVDGVILDFTGPFSKFWNTGLQEKCWIGNVFSDNPDTWAFGLRPGIDDETELNKALHEFHQTHDHLPLLHPDIVTIMSELKQQYKIELVTAYPNAQKRLGNLMHHNLPYDVLSCGIIDKAAHIQAREREGDIVVAIFEDAPHHLGRYLPHYSDKLWAPSHWNYLSHMKDNKRIRFYDSPREWKELL